MELVEVKAFMRCYYILVTELNEFAENIEFMNKYIGTFKSVWDEKFSSTQRI